MRYKIVSAGDGRELGGGHISTRAPQPLKGPSDRWAEVGQDAYDNEKKANRACDEDSKTSTRDGQGLTDGIFSQVPENQGQHQGDNRIIEFLHDVAQYAKTEHHPNIEEVIVDGVGAHRCEDHNKAHQDRIGHS